MQSHLGVTFYPAFNDQVLLYGKRIPGGRDMILVAVSLDPHNVQEAAIEVPLWEWGLPDDASLAATDLMRGHRFVWTGKRQRIRLDPADLPFAIWQVAPPGARMMDIARPLRCRAPAVSRAERGHAVVQGRDHLSAARQVVLRCQQ